MLIEKLEQWLRQEVEDFTRTLELELSKEDAIYFGARRQQAMVTLREIKLLRILEDAD